MGEIFKRLTEQKMESANRVQIPTELNSYLLHTKAHENAINPSDPRD